METQEATRKGLSTTDAAMALKQLREKSANPEPEVTEEQEPQNQAESAEIEAEADTETEVTEVQEDQAETEVQEEAEPSDDDNNLYEIEGMEFTSEELRNAKKGLLQEANSTKRWQEAAEMKREAEESKLQLATDRQQFELERSQVTETLKAQQLQLQEALASFAIEQDPRPSSQGKSWEQHSQELAEWEQREAKRAQAKQAYEALQAQERQATVSRELQQLLMKRPDWRDETAWRERMGEAQSVAAEYGVSADEFATLTDHRFFLALHDLHTLRQGMNTQQAKESAAAKKVVKAVKKLAPGAKPEQKTGVQKQAQEAKARARKSGRPQDALAALKAARAARRG